MAQSTDQAMAAAYGFVKDGSAGAAQKPKPEPPRPQQPSLADRIYKHLVPNREKANARKPR